MLASAVRRAGGLWRVEVRTTGNGIPEGYNRRAGGALHRERRDRYRRVLAICYAGKLVHRGWALAYRRYGLTYVRHEAEARATRRGLWGSSFTPPWTWWKLMQ